MLSATYVSLITRACPGLFTDQHFIRYHLPQEQGWAYAHAYLVSQGMPMVWPRRQDNPEGRWWDGVVQWFRARRAAKRA